MPGSPRAPMVKKSKGQSPPPAVATPGQVESLKEEEVQSETPPLRGETTTREAEQTAGTHVLAGAISPSAAKLALRPSRTQDSRRPHSWVRRRASRACRRPPSLLRRPLRADYPLLRF